MHLQPVEILHLTVIILFTHLIHLEHLLQLKPFILTTWLLLAVVVEVQVAVVQVVIVQPLMQRAAVEV
jgi:hypothetical protein